MPIWQLQCFQSKLAAFAHAHCGAQEVSDACRTGAATNIIFGLALGYQSAIVPCIVIAACIFIGFSFASLFGIACAALGMLTTLATGALLPLVGNQRCCSVCCCTSAHVSLSTWCIDHLSCSMCHPQRLRAAGWAC